MISPTKLDIGRAVFYKEERGIITEMNDKYVFVRYSSQHPAAAGQATRREDLRWEHQDKYDEIAERIRDLGMNQTMWTAEPIAAILRESFPDLSLDNKEEV